MGKAIRKSNSADDEKQVPAPRKSKKALLDRIDEEKLFKLFTANIMKLKKKFVR